MALFEKESGREIVSATLRLSSVVIIVQREILSNVKLVEKKREDTEPKMKMFTFAKLRNFPSIDPYCFHILRKLTKDSVDDG